MVNRSRTLLQHASVIGLYVGGSLMASHLLHGPDQVALIWLPAGIALALLLTLGRQVWPTVMVADLLSQTLLDAPLAFMPFSAAANTLSALAGATLALRLGGAEVKTFSVRTGVVGLAASALASAISAPLGVTGLLVAGMTPADAAGAALAKWFIGNLFGMLLVTPALRLAYQQLSERRSGRRRMGFSGRREVSIWIALLALSGVTVLLSGHVATTYTLGLTGLPLALLLWAAMRFPPLITAIGSLLVGVGMTLIVGLGLGGFFPPPTLYDAVVLLVFLSVVSLVPLFLSAVTYERRLAASQIVHSAQHDELTGLNSRVGFEARARELIEGGGEEPMAFAYIDLDQFKLINDTASHAVGDALVKSLASAIVSRLGADDVAGRIGGDEFGLLLRRQLPLEAERSCEGVRKAISEFRYPHAGHVYSITASIGLVPFQPRRIDYPELLAQADAACFTAKEQGGNRVQPVVSGKAARERSAAMLWAMRLNSAMDQDRFQLYCQTIAPLLPQQGSGRHFEVLTRMIDPQTGEMLQPDQFVAAAERFRLGTRLDRHVIEQTLRWLETHPKALAEVEMCGINLCAASVNDPEFLVFLRARLARSSVPHDRLCFEITETSAIRDLSEARRFIDALQALGCRLALDDFGTGFCSFAYLNTLNVDFFKIDGSFVRELDSSTLSLSIVRAIADIARSINKHTIAEFVHSESVRDRLLEIGVDYAQGFAIDRPTPIDDYFAAPPPALSSVGAQAA